MKFDNKVVLVTGANRGIGTAIVKELLKHKVAKVYAAARNPKSLPDFGDSRVVPLAIDITNDKQIAAAAALAKDVNVLINNAGIASFVSLIDGTPEQIAADMNTNYFGTLSVIRAFVPVLQKNGHGVIASIASILSLAPISAAGGYSASKAALHSAIQSLRSELAPKNIHVVGIYPGPIDTDMGKSIPMAKATPETTAQGILAGLAADEEYIFPDPMSQQGGPLFLSNPRALEQHLAKSLPEAA